MVTYAYPKPGNIFVLTPIGYAIGRVRVKYDNEEKNRRYSHVAPQAWLDKGWIIEKEADSNGNKA